ncbi:MAG TPA: hypothetical protein VLU46_03790 [Thermoanaerobaculia bacterium]|nr:hypothetical protein [Thermoanaerobaculia bacterium]
MQDSGAFVNAALSGRIRGNGEKVTKRALIAGIGLVAAASLLAGTDNTAQQTTTAATTATTATAAKPAEDSPLVKAAKKSKRSSSKRIVITNEDLKSAQGHITTTSVPLKPLNIPDPDRSTEQVLLETRTKEKERAAQREKENREAADKRRQEIAKRVAAAEDDGYLDDDPQAERKLDQTTSTAAKPDAKSDQPARKQ